MDKVAEVLKQLAQQLGTTVERLWPVLVEQQRIQGIIGVCMFATALPTLGIVLYCLRRSPWVNEDGLPTLRAVGLISMVVTSLLFASILSQLITQIVNPEYWALRDLMKMVHP